MKKYGQVRSLGDFMVSKNSNKLHSVLKDFEFYFPEEFEKTSVKRCGHCNATGIKDKQQLFFCDNCGGTGYVGYEKIQKNYTCRSCNGGGCAMCYNTGMVDWVTHATGEDVKTGNK